MRLAAVDIGTNTVRLLAAEQTGAGLIERRRDATVVGLGIGVDRTGRLSGDAIDRALEALSRYETWTRASDRCMVVATAASRDAANRDDFFDAVERVVGHRPQLISGEEEAALSFAGATAGRAGGPFLVVDIGGGSTELVVGQGVPEFVQSIQLGSVRLTERAEVDLPASASVVTRARDHARAAFAGLEPARSSMAIGVAGTFTSLAALALDLDVYDRERVHGARLESSTLTLLVERLAQLTLAQTRALPTMEERRAPFILGGAIVAETVTRLFSPGAVEVSERDLLDGVVAALLAQ